MRITDYPQVTQLTAEDVFLVDGTAGTRQILASDALLAAMSFTSVFNRRRVFRGKNLGTSLTTDQKTQIQNGTFKGLWLGDYWQINGVKWRIADFDYWYNSGDSQFNQHHLVIVPDTNLGSVAKMNSSAVTTGGYTGSAMYTTNLSSAKSTISGAFADAVLSHREYLITTVTSGYPSAGEWKDSTVDLMNEFMVYGTSFYTPSGEGTINVKRYTNSPNQLALFAVAPYFIFNTEDGTRISYWLRDVANATSFSRVSSYGAPQDTSASAEYGIRPAFAIG